MKKIKLRKKYKISNILTLIIISIMIILLLIFNYIGKYITPVIINYAKKEAKKISLDVITKSVNIDTEKVNVDTGFGAKFRAFFRAESAWRSLSLMTAPRITQGVLQMDWQRSTHLSYM